MTRPIWTDTRHDAGPPVPVDIVRRLRDDDEYESEGGGWAMYEVRLPDGRTEHAFNDELHFTTKARR